MQQQNLLGEEFKRRESHVSSAGPDVGHQFEKRPVIVDIPNQVRQEDQKCGNATQPEPLLQQNTALPGQQKSHHNAETQDRWLPRPHFSGTYPPKRRVCYRAVVGSVYNSSTMAVAQFTDCAQIDESLPAR